MFQLSETEENGGGNPATIQSNSKEKAEHREIQMWERETGREVGKKQGGGWVTRELRSKSKTTEICPLLHLEALL